MAVTALPTSTNSTELSSALGTENKSFFLWAKGLSLLPLTTIPYGFGVEG